MKDIYKEIEIFKIRYSEEIDEDKRILNNMIENVKQINSEERFNIIDSIAEKWIILFEKYIERKLYIKKLYNDFLEESNIYNELFL